MEEDMVEAEYNSTVYEIDIDYEFDAARFFDFSRDESPLEARQAELWFNSAESYPPSPFLARLVLMENVNIFPKSKGVETMNLSKSDSGTEAEHEISAKELNYGAGQDTGISSSVHIGSQQKIQNQTRNIPSGLALYNHMVNPVNSENHTKRSKKPAVPRTSTLMKPTASQLAKQNHPFQAGHSRSCVSLLDKTSKSTGSTCVIENQAAKRQKLEGGLPRKVPDTGQLQQTTFVHKGFKRDELLGGNVTQAKARITIPRDPDFETAYRAQKTRERSSKDENVTSTVRRFKALPLNRKILEAPSLLPKRSTPRIPDFQEFHLNTSERALQHSSAILNSTVPSDHSNKDLHKFTTNLTRECGSREPGRPSLMSKKNSRPAGCQSSHSFKALPLNKKELNFQKEKRFPNTPPIELFNKLSLACETQPHPKAPWSLSRPTKGSQENRWGCSQFQQGHEVTQPAKVKLPLFGGIQQFRADVENIEVSFASWSQPIQ